MDPLFPYEPRTGQPEIVQTLRGHLSQHRHCVMQSGTGTGKTICTLAACIGQLREDGKLLYLTRTNSQQKQVMSELRAISERLPVFGIAVQGRRHMCPFVETDESLKSGNHDELSRLCGLKKAKVINGDPGGCRYYHSLISGDFSGILKWARENLPTAEEFVEHCVDRGVCPYELNKILIQSAKVVTAPYIYFFSPFIRNTLLDWMACDIDNILLVVDEAHNLPGYSKELRSASLSLGTLRLASREAAELRDPEVSEGTSALDFLRLMEEILADAVEEFVIDEDGLIPSDMLEELLMGRLKLTSKGIIRLAGEVVNLGDIVRERRKKEGKLPRSHLHSVGSFLSVWMSVSEEDYVKLVIGGESPAFEAYCLDSSLACTCIHETSGSIHMSGTLDPLEEYRDSIGLPGDSPLLSFPSPFPEKNRMVLFADDVTSKYEDFSRDGKNLSRMKGYICDIVREINRNTAVFFPSHNLLKLFVDNGLLKEIGVSCFVEEKGMPQDELMELVSDFKSCPDAALLLAVSGGRISEGIDFPDSELEVVVLAGIPYPKPSAKTRALQHYYEIKFGRGWEYVVKAPTTRKMLQAIGRLIRSEKDRGVAAILDKRAIHFSRSISADMTRDPVTEMRRFFEPDREMPKIPVQRRKIRRERKTISSASRPVGPY